MLAEKRVFLKEPSFTFDFHHLEFLYFSQLIFLSGISLYTHYNEIPENELINPEKIKEILNDEKSKVKRNSLKIIFSAT